MAVKYNITGAIVGPLHAFASRLLTDGRSLHPLQRTGEVDHTGWPSIPAARTPSISDAPHAGGPQLAYPNVLNISITTATNPAARV